MHGGISNWDQAFAATQRWGHQTVIHAMTKHARELGKPVIPELIRSINAEALEVANRLWGECISDDSKSKSDGIKLINGYTSSVLDWCIEHLKKVDN